MYVVFITNFIVFQFSIFSSPYFSPPVLGIYLLFRLHNFLSTLVMWNPDGVFSLKTTSCLFRVADVRSEAFSHSQSSALSTRSFLLLVLVSVDQSVIDDVSLFQSWARQVSKCYNKYQITMSFSCSRSFFFKLLQSFFFQILKTEAVWFWVDWNHLFC